LLTLPGCAALDVPIGPWSALAGDAGARNAEFLALRSSYCLPTPAEVGSPVFPGSEVFWITWSKRAPHCDAPEQAGGERFELILVTAAEMGEVLAWYQARLPGFARYPAPDGVILLQGEGRDFLWERDLGRLPVPYVLIAGLREAWRKIGYRTSIDLGRPDP
jgi:hypothetical protein